MPDTIEKPVKERFQRGGQEQISLTLPPGLTDRIDAAAKSLGMTRKAYIVSTVIAALAKHERVHGATRDAQGT